MLGFLTMNKKVIKFTIDNRIIKYYDDSWKDGVQFMPKDSQMVTKLIRKGGDFKELAIRMMKANAGDNLIEYESCKTEEELAGVVRREAKSQGLLEVK
jgi:repressor of nif and glnA expression